MAKTWSPSKRWDGWLSYEDFLALSELATKLAAEAGHERAPRYSAEWPDTGSVQAAERGEFERDLEETEMTDLKQMSFIAGSSLPPPFTREGVSISLGCFSSLTDDYTTLTVGGDNRTVVLGIFAQLEEAVVKKLAKHDESRPLRWPKPKAPEPAASAGVTFSDVSGPVSVNTGTARDVIAQPAPMKVETRDWKSWLHNP